MPRETSSSFSSSPYSSLEDYVRKCNGKRVIERVLVSNNGIGAVKAIRSMRKWSYEMFSDDRAVKFIAMATPEDMRANAEYIRMADECIEVPGGSNVNNYANVSLIVQTAKQANADAVWPGWGHASENPALVDALVAASITFIGPPARPMRLLGDKIGSTIIAQSARVPTIAWNGDGLEVDVKTLSKGIPDDMYSKANVVTVEQAVECSLRIGCPVMIKASEGGGGKGIRRVDVDDEDLIKSAYRQVQAEVPGSPIFVMKLSSGARHLEVQLLADEHGQAIALSGRDCSVQRRHQKIVEEGPPVACTVLTPDVWVEMERAAVRLAKAVNYVNAGTVEYLYKNGEFFFLELNPRLQVEHPVTEMITGVNLPAAQLQVAMGIPLHNIADVRQCYVQPGESGERDELEYGIPSAAAGADPARKIDFDSAPPIKPKGHVIAARITAENPDAGFTPTSGAIQELNFRSTPSVWGYFSVDSSGRVHEFADSQIGHLFAFGSTRNKARKAMILALKEMSIRGEIRTTVEYLVKLMESPDFRANNIDTTWLDARIAQDKIDRKALEDQNSKDNAKDSVEDGNDSMSQKERRQAAALHTALIGAACHAHSWSTENEKEFTAALERGQIPSAELVMCETSFELILRDVKYCISARLGGPNVYVLSCNNNLKECVRVAVRPLSDGGRLVMLGGKSYTVYAKNDASGLRLTVDGATHVFTKAYDPTKVVATNSGKLVAYTVSDGDHVDAGMPFCEIEVMKMIMPLVAPEAGHIHFQLAEGAVLEPGDIIAKMVLDDPSKVRKSTLFRGGIPAYGEPWPTNADTQRHNSIDRPQVVLRDAIGTLRDVFFGWQVPSKLVQGALRSLDELIFNERLSILEFEEAMASVSSSPLLPDSLKSQLNALTPAGSSQLDVKKIKTLIHEHCSTIPTRMSESLLELLQPLVALSDRHSNGPYGLLDSIVSDLVQEYLSCERPFSGRLPDSEVVLRLRREHAPDMNKVFQICLSHGQIERKNALVLALLRRYEKRPQSYNQSERSSILKDLASLTQQNSGASKHAPVTLKARQLLIQQHMPNDSQRRAHFEHLLGKSPLPPSTTIEGKALVDRTNTLSPLIEQETPVLPLVLHVLSTGASTQQDSKRRVALEVYIRRLYRSYEVISIEAAGEEREIDGIVSLLKFKFKADEDSSVLVKSGSSNNLSAIFQGANKMEEAAEVIDRRGCSSKEHRIGVIAVFEKYDQLESSFGALVDSIDGNNGEHHVMHIAVLDDSMGGRLQNDDDLHFAEKRLVDRLSNIVSFNVEKLRGSGIHRVTFVTKHAPRGPEGSRRNTDGNFDFEYKIERNDQSSKSMDNVGRVSEDDTKDNVNEGVFTFRRALNYAEDTLIRDTEPTLAFRLELERLSKFEVHQVFSRNRAIHVYHAMPKASELAKIPSEPKFSSRKPKPQHRFFVRALVRDDTANIALAVATRRNTINDPEKNKEPTPEDVGDVLNAVVSRAHPGPEARFVECLDALEVAISDLPQGSVVYGNHIFLNMLPAVVVHPEYVHEVIRQVSQRYSDRIRRLGVTSVEFRMDARSTSAAPKIPVRLIATNPTGYVLKVGTYVEVTDPTTGNTIFQTLTREMAERYTLAAAAASVGDDSNSTQIGGSHVISSYKTLARRSSSSNSIVDLYSSASGDNEKARTISTQSIGVPGDFGGLHGKPKMEPYALSSRIDKRRQTAARITDTIYVYDFIDLFERAVSSSYRTAGRRRPPGKLVDAIELIIPKGDHNLGGGALEQVRRPAGQNDIGMVAWLLTLKTPESPSKQGRRIILIGNDITHKAGSFGTREDELFLRATQYARELGLPRIYTAANSGARIGMASEVRDAFKVSWVDPSDPSKGFEYLYLTPEDNERLRASNAVITKPIEVVSNLGFSPGSMSRGHNLQRQHSETRYVITDIIGAGRDLGVENLRGSGTIAGETSRAYSDVFTLTYVTGRCVGIGAYLVRLGQRTIQKESAAPILLTGYQALNKLMGKQVYTSNLQLGGPDIMYTNGVSHQVVQDDYQGVREILKWLSYVPIYKGGPLPMLISSDGGDSPDRNIEVQLQEKEIVDPRLLLAGYMRSMDGNSMPGETKDAKPSNTGVLGSAEGSNPFGSEWVAGFFDKNSWYESMSAWAKTVVTGRARLGGIPVGVIVTESRTVEKTAPADPAAPTSMETVTMQAGQVWFPDSAFKTATAVRDFAGEDLPLMIFANWRGFSGGQRDMYDEVLKFGSLIVDALVEYKNPVFVYLPPFSTLRGGAWVVIDPTINADVMEMYADPRARGGILEPAGIVSIKYRKPDLLKTANRIDPVLKQLREQLSGALDIDAVKDLQQKVAAREQLVLGTYLQIATHFADLHDTPGRMEAKGVIHGVVPWKRARTYFYYRLRRKLAEFALRRAIIKSAPNVSSEDASRRIREWFLESAAKAKKMVVAPQPAWKQYAGGIDATSPGIGQDIDDDEMNDHGHLRKKSEDSFMSEKLWKNDKKVLSWLNEGASGIDEKLARLVTHSVREQIQRLMNGLDAEGRKEVVSGLKGLM